MAENETVAADKAEPPQVEVEWYDGKMRYASAIRLTFVGNDYILIFAQPRFGMATDGEKQAAVHALDTTAAITVSPLTLKDLSLLVTRAVERYEADYGEIVTDFTRGRAERDAKAKVAEAKVAARKLKKPRNPRKK